MGHPCLDKECLIPDHKRVTHSMAFGESVEPIPIMPVPAHPAPLIPARPESTPEPGIRDLVVIGGGLAGLSCAARAAELGLAVQVLEQGTDEHYPCNSRYSGGMFHLNYLDIADPPSRLEAALRRMVPADIDAEVIVAIGVNARRCVQWLQDHARARFVRVGPAHFEKWVLAPPRPPKAGLVHPGRGPDVVLTGLAHWLSAMGMPVRRGARVTDVTRADPQGLYTVTFEQDGRPVSMQTRALTCADGGFQARPDLIGEHISPAPHAIVTRNAATGIGTSLAIAPRLGAQLSELRNFYGHLQARNAQERTDLWPYPMIDSVAKASLVVGPDGRRFADETRGGVYLANRVARRADPSDAIVVFDDAVWWSVGRESRVPPNPVATNHGGTLHSAGSIAELARRAGIDADGLAVTVAGHNRFIANHGQHPMDPPRSYAAAWAHPITTPPFHAMPVCAGMTYTMGGIRITPRAEALAVGGGIVPGLFAAGAATGGVEGGELSFYIGGLCKALTLGVLAGESAVDYIHARGDRSNAHASSQRSPHDATA